MNEITTRTERITADASGIITCVVLTGALLGLDDAKENVQAVKLMANGKRVPVFVDITASKGASKEARAYLASQEVAEIQSACAMLVNSPLSHLIGNFFLGLNKTKFPIRLFQDENKAKECLTTFL